MTALLRIPIADLLVNGKPESLEFNDLVWNLNLDQVESNTGKIIDKVRIPLAELGPSTYPFTAGTLLYSKLRPYLNKVVVADEAGYATTELVPLRCDQCKVFAPYLAYFLRSPEFLNFAYTVVAGAKMPRMVMGEFWRFQVPLPSLNEQRRIAAILDQADALRAQRREALAQLDSLTQSIFIEMFGDFQSGAIHWPEVRLEDVTVDTKIGLVRSAQEFGSDFNVPYVRMNAVGRFGEFLPELVQRTDVSPDELREFQLQPGDLLFNTRNSQELVGKTAIFREQGPYVYNNNLMRIRFDDRIDPEYAAAAFKTAYVQQELAMRKSGTTSVFAIYARELKSLLLPIPPIALQQTFATRIQAVEALKATHRTALAELDALFASLQHRAFRGEL